MLHELAPLAEADRLSTRPNAGGWWFWFEGLSLDDDFENCARKPERLLLTSDGAYVVDDGEFEQITGIDPDQDGWHENYWAQTETTQKEMPGLWMPVTKNPEPKTV